MFFTICHKRGTLYGPVCVHLTFFFSHLYKLGNPGGFPKGLRESRELHCRDSYPKLFRLPTHFCPSGALSPPGLHPSAYLTHECLSTRLAQCSIASWGLSITGMETLGLLPSQLRLRRHDYQDGLHGTSGIPPLGNPLQVLHPMHSSKLGL